MGLNNTLDAEDHVSVVADYLERMSDDADFDMDIYVAENRWHNIYRDLRAKGWGVNREERSGQPYVYKGNVRIHIGMGVRNRG